MNHKHFQYWSRAIVVPASAILHFKLNLLLCISRVASGSRIYYRYVVFDWTKHDGFWRINTKVRCDGTHILETDKVNRYSDSYSVCYYREFDFWTLTSKCENGFLGWRTNVTRAVFREEEVGKLLRDGMKFTFKEKNARSGPSVSLWNLLWVDEF